MLQSQNFFLILFLLILFSCETNHSNETDMLYTCLGDVGGCVSEHDGEFETIDDCNSICTPKPNSGSTTITVFLYENCPIAQYMCGPLREVSRYFCDTLNQNMIFRAFSPNSFSTNASLLTFAFKYDIPFPVSLDYNQLDSEPGPYTQYYLPIVTPEVFVEFNGQLIYRGMIDNSYQSLGQWSPPSEDYLKDILTNIANGLEIDYSETQAVGCLINY
ncbi:MAG: hypothetical protein CMP54_01435 [Flavobacteriales bacterium]|nr:hypothetical protein [Flavobacteriales bacterium]